MTPEQENLLILARAKKAKAESEAAPQPDISTYTDMFGRNHEGVAEMDPAAQKNFGGFEILPLLGTAALAELPSGLSGLATLGLTGDPIKAGEVTTAVQNTLTYTPKTQGGLEVAQDIGSLLSPIDKALKSAGKATLDATGSPLLATMVETGPYMALELLGFKGASKLRGSRKVLGITDDMADTLKRAGKTVDDLSPDDVAALQRSLVDESITRQQRKTILDSVGVDEPTRAQLTRNADDFQMQQELAKTNNSTRLRLERQEGQLLDAVDQRQLATGGEGVSSTSSAIDEVTGRSVMLDKQITNAYNIAREAAPDAKDIKFDRLAASLKSNAPSNEITGGMIKAVRGYLIENGIIDKKFKAVGKVDLETAENARVFINSQFDSTTPRGRTLMREFKEALDEDIFASQPNNALFQKAKQAKIDFERGLDSAKVSKFDVRKTNLVRDMLENKLDPDRFVDNAVFLKKYRAEDLQQLSDYLKQSPSGAKAWDDLRAQTFEGIKNRIFTGPEDANGVRALSRAKLESTLNSIGSAKRKKLFSPEENAFLDNLVEAAKLREPVRGTALGRGPSAQAIGRLQASMERVPLAKMLVEIKEVIDDSGRVRMTLQPSLEVPQLSTRLKSGLSGQGAVGGAIQSTILQEQENKEPVQ